MYRIGTQSFRTKADITVAFQEVLRSYDLGHPITDRRHLELVQGLAVWHPRWVEKQRDGIAVWYIDRNQYGTRSVWLEYEDGTDDDISIMSCIRELGSSE